MYHALSIPPPCKVLVPPVILTLSIVTVPLDMSITLSLKPLKLALNNGTCSPCTHNIQIGANIQIPPILLT